MERLLEDRIALVTGATRGLAVRIGPRAYRLDEIQGRPLKRQQLLFFAVVTRFQG